MQDFVTVLSVLFVIIFSVFVDTYYKVIWHKHKNIPCASSKCRENWGATPFQTITSIYTMASGEGKISRRRFNHTNFFFPVSDDVVVIRWCHGHKNSHEMTLRCIKDDVKGYSDALCRKKQSPFHKAPFGIEFTYPTLLLPMHFFWRSNTRMTTE